MRRHPVPSSAIDYVARLPVTSPFLGVNWTDEVTWAGRVKLLSPLWTGQLPSEEGLQ